MAEFKFSHYPELPGQKQVRRSEAHFSTSEETRLASPTSGTDGRPCLYKDGNAGWKATCDERGNKTSESFFGADGKPCLLKHGYAEMKWTHGDAHGNMTSESYFGTDGNLCLMADGKAEVAGAPSTSGGTRQASPTWAPTASPVWSRTDMPRRGPPTTSGETRRACPGSAPTAICA